MTGADHYAEAERLLRAANTNLRSGDQGWSRAKHDINIAHAQVHATLALAGSLTRLGAPVYVSEITTYGPVES